MAANDPFPHIFPSQPDKCAFSFAATAKFPNRCLPSTTAQLRRTPAALPAQSRRARRRAIFTASCHRPVPVSQ